MSDGPRTKVGFALFSSALVLLVILLYYLDTSLAWGATKISSCVIVNLWVFFAAPALRQGYLDNRHQSLAKWFEMGLRFGVSGICLPLLGAPLYGLRYYFSAPKV